VLIEREMLRLEADPPKAEGLETLGDQRPEAVRRPGSDEREARGFGFHLKPVAAVAQDFRGGPADDQVTEAAAEARDIADVLWRRDDHAVKLEVHQAPPESRHPARRLITSHRPS